MKITEISIKRPITILMVVLLVILLGIVSFIRIPMDLFPNMTFPVAVVMTQYQGVGPSEIESMVTKPLEEVLGSVANVKEIRSTSSENSSLVIIEFNSGTDMDFTSLDMREKIDMIKGFFPEEVSNPLIFQYDPNLLPIMEIAMVGENDTVETTELINIVERELKNNIERIDGVASVEITGGNKREITVEVRQSDLNKYAMNMTQISQMLAMENINLPSGSIVEEGKKLTLRTLGNFTDIDQIINLPINTPFGVIHLRDIANVKAGFKEDLGVSKLNGQSAIGISIQKESNANTVNISKEIYKKVDEFISSNPQVSVKYTSDQSEYIEWTLKLVGQNAILGGILAAFILFLFLKNIRSTIIVGLAIPISVISIFILMYFNNITFNMVSLGGIALGIGMLVDNSIVVLENIYRYSEMGYDSSQAALKGTNEVGMAITASTLTTIGVFIPIIFVEGMVVTIFKEMALVVAFSLFSSLIVALTFIPMLCSKFLKTKQKSISWLEWFDNGFEFIVNKYQKLVKWVLSHRKATLILLLLIFFVSLSLINIVGMEFMPIMDQGEIQINVELSKGTLKSEVNEVLFRVEKMLLDIPEIDSIFVTSTRSSSPIGRNDDNTGTISCKLVPIKERERSTKDVAEEIRRETSIFAGAEISVRDISFQSMMSSDGSSISIKILGQDLNILKIISEDIVKLVEEVEGTREVFNNMSKGLPEIQIILNRNRMVAYGYNTATIATLIKNQVEGITATRYKLNGEEIDILIITENKINWDKEDLENISFLTNTGSTITLGEFAEIRKGISPISINRQNQSRVVTINSQIYQRDLGSITKDIEVKLNNYVFPMGYDYEIGGESKEMQEAFSSLYLAGILAIAIVFMVLSSQFESLVYPWSIMMTVPFAITGALFGLVITNTIMSITAFIGIIMLVGIVVNNAIVLVDYINNLRKNGLKRYEAIIQAGKTRLKPIFMTTLTTVLGLIPLTIAAGEGSELEKPLAIAVIGGLLFSTLLTLLIVPVIYTIIDDLLIKITKKNDRI